MLFSASIVSMLVAFVAAQTANFDPITSPRSGQPVSTSSTLRIVWEDTVSEPITITLLQGASQGTLQLGDVIAKSIDSSTGTFAWKVDPSVAGFATYGFKLSLDSDPSTFQYSFPFVITASSSSSVSSSSTLALQNNAQAVSQAIKTVVVSSAFNTETSVATSEASSETSSSPFVSSNSTNSASAPQVTFPSSSNSSSSGSGSNVTFTSSTKSASKSASLTTSATKTPGSVVTGSPTSSSGPASKTSSGAISEAAVQCLSLMGALGLSVAMVL